MDSTKAVILALGLILVTGMASAQAPDISNAQQNNPDTFLNEGTISADVSNNPETVEAEILAKQRVKGGFYSPYVEMNNVNVTVVETLTMTDQDGDGTYTTEHDYDWTDMRGFKIVASNSDGTNSQMINFCTEDGCDDDMATDDPDKMARPVKFNPIVFPGEDDKFTQEFAHDFKSDRILELRRYSITSRYKEDQTTTITDTNGNEVVVETTIPKNLPRGDPDSVAPENETDFASIPEEDEHWGGNRLYHQKFQVDASNLEPGVANIHVYMDRWEDYDTESLGANLMDRELVIGQALTGSTTVVDNSVTVDVSNPNPSSMFNKTVRYENNTCHQAVGCPLKVKSFKNYDVSKAEVDVYVTDGENKEYVAQDHVVEANSSDTISGAFDRESLDLSSDWYLMAEAENPEGTDMPVKVSEKIREGNNPKLADDKRDYVPEDCVSCADEAVNDEDPGLITGLFFGDTSSESFTGAFSSPDSDGLNLRNVFVLVLVIVLVLLYFRNQ